MELNALFLKFFIYFFGSIQLATSATVLEFMKDLCYNPKKTYLVSGDQIFCFNQINNHSNVIIPSTTTLSTNNTPIVEH
jgi:hypothetical protein